MYDLVVFSHLRWNFVYQRPQHLLSRLARSRRVLFIEEPMYTTAAPHIQLNSPCAGVTVLSVHTPVVAQGFNDAQLQVMQPLLSTWFKSNEVKKPVVWFYTPMALPLLAAAKPRSR